jgi:hypothetical protein
MNYLVFQKGGDAFDFHDDAGDYDLLNVNI